MPEARKVRSTPPRSTSDGRRRPLSTPKSRPFASADEPRCWLCSRPLAAAMVAPVLEPGMFEVHRRCREEALRS